MSDRHDIDRTSAETALRMQLALARFPVAVGPLDEPFVNWMAAQLDREHVGDRSFGFNFDADHAQVGWTNRSGVPEHAPDGSSGGGEWIAADASFGDHGWFAEGAFDWTQVVDSVLSDLHAPTLLLVGSWLADTGTRLGAITRCVEPSHPFADLTFDLPGDDTVDQMMIGMDLFDVLGIDGPPTPTLGPVLNAPGVIRLLLSITPDGIRAAGYSADGLSSDRLVELLVTVDETTVTKTGETMGVLGVTDPSSIDLIDTVDGPRVIVHTTPA